MNIFSGRWIIFGVIILVLTGSFAYARREKQVAGVVLDCNTKQPVEGVEVLVNQRGWGFSENGVGIKVMFIQRLLTCRDAFP